MGPVKQVLVCRFTGHLADKKTVGSGIVFVFPLSVTVLVQSEGVGLICFLSVYGYFLCFFRGRLYSRILLGLTVYNKYIIIVMEILICIIFIQLHLFDYHNCSSDG